MIRFFRALRKRLLTENRVRRYLAYALGEIFLVGIGILLALQVNNWNEARKESAYEITMLRELDRSLSNDSMLIARLFEPRIDRKEQAIDSLLYLSGTRQKVAPTRFMELYGHSKTLFQYRFNEGPYETIKSNGLALISNDELRAEITRLYEVSFPAFRIFLESPVDNALPLIRTLEQDFLEIELHEEAQGRWQSRKVPKTADVLNHPSFKWVLRLEADIASNYRSRINTIKSLRTSLHDRVREELNNRTRP